MIKISVIIPAYNVEKTLRRCLNSFLAQSFEEYEIILIDDGSTDKTKEICDEYQLKDARVKVIHTSNQGVSQARERGIREAKGMYSIHADGDDWVEPDMLSQLYAEAMKHNADLVIADYYLETDKQTYCAQQPSVMQGKNIICDILSGKMHGSTWNKLIRHQLYEEHKIHFPKDINFCEDALTIIKLLMHAQRIAYLPKAYYHYIYNPQSITRFTSREKFEERKLYIAQIKQLLTAPFFYKSIQETLLRIKIDAYYSKLFTAKELKQLYPENNKYIIYSTYSLNLKILILLTSWGMYPLATFLEKKLLKVKD